MKLNVLLTTLLLFPSVWLSAQIQADKVVMLDNYYNHEVNKEGRVWHYTWDDTSIGGYSQLGELFQQEGGTLRTLANKPTAEALKDCKVYLITDPDIERENPHPNYMDAETAHVILDWVRKGGRLMVFTNDKGNCDLQQINLLTDKAGIHFNSNSIANENRGASGNERHYDDCAFTHFAKHPLFKGVSKIFLKGVCTIACTSPAKPLVKSEQDEVVMARAKMGKGEVIAVTDPWLYNEYIAHLYLPNDFTNEQAARNLVKWLLRK